MHLSFRSLGIHVQFYSFRVENPKHVTTKYHETLGFFGILFLVIKSHRLFLRALFNFGNETCTRPRLSQVTGVPCLERTNQANPPNYVPLGRVHIDFGQGDRDTKHVANQENLEVKSRCSLVAAQTKFPLKQLMPKQARDKP